MSRYGIIATGPISKHERGTLSFRLVIRHTLDSEGKVDEYIVANQTWDDAGRTFSFNLGNYFPLRAYSGEYEERRTFAWRRAVGYFVNRLAKHANHHSPIDPEWGDGILQAHQYGEKQSGASEEP